MKHPLHKFSKKNRNIISGVLVGIATTIAVASYFKLPKEDVAMFLGGIVILLISIIVLAIITVCIFKGLVTLKDLLLKK